MPQTPIDLSNRFLIGIAKSQVVVGRVPPIVTPTEALVLAAWLVAIAQPLTSVQFATLLADVKRS